MDSTCIEKNTVSGIRLIGQKYQAKLVLEPAKLLGAWRHCLHASADSRTGVEIAQEQLSEAPNWQDKFEESLRRRERRNLVGKEGIYGDSTLPEQDCLNEEQSSMVARGEYQSNCCPRAVLTKLILNLEFLLKLTWILIPS